MKKLFNILCAAAALLPGLAGCQQSKQEPLDTVELRYRADDSYSLEAVNARAFTILVASSKPWTITSEHPTWCIISDEDGQPVDPETLHVGKAEPTTVRVQYYDNTFLDDRTDRITIQSNGWVGKTITVSQKGIAFLSVPEDELALDVEKSGGQFTIHIHSNQPWSSKVTDGDWVSIEEGESGEGEGEVVINAEENVSELRYAEVTVYDRHDEPVALVKFTQDGVQLVPLSEEIRAGYDQLSAELELLSNSKWTVEKAAESDDWFTIETPSGEGNGTISISFTENTGSSMRRAEIVVKNVVDSADEFQVEKPVVVKQAYKIDPVRYYVNNDEISLWKSDWANTPVYTKDVGTLFAARCRLSRSMEFGSYTFHWKDLQADANGGNPRVRHWFTYSESAEIKADLRPGDAKVSFDFNVAGDGNKPSISAFTDVDFTQPIDLTVKFDPSGAEHCHVTFLVNGIEAGSFDSSENLLRTILWGKSSTIYFGVDEGGSAVCEWYEYTAPMNWDD